MLNYQRTIGMALSFLVVAALFFYFGTRVGRNSDAILKSCILLSNKIIESRGQAGSGKVLIKEILLNAEQHGRPEVVIQYRRAVKGSKPLQLLDCERISEHPDTIKALPTPAPTR